MVRTPSTTKMNKFAVIFSIVGVCVAQYSSNGYSQSSTGSRSPLSAQYSARGGNGGYQARGSYSTNGRFQGLLGGISQYGSGASRGYGGNAQGYGQNGRLGGLDNSEPARYEFKYDVDAPEYGVEFGHEEQRDGDNTNGAYYVLLPDGRRQLVEYTADLDGYHPRISYTEAAAPGGFGGNQGNGYGAGGSYQSGNSRNGGYQNGGYQSGGYQNGGIQTNRANQAGYSSSAIDSAY